jgi:hypothetical protein
VLTPLFWVSASFTNFQHFSKSMMRSRRGLMSYYGNHFRHRPSRLWDSPNAGSKHTGLVVAECGTGKTLISLGAIHVHSDGNPFTALALVPPHLLEKWAREAFFTLPGVRVFLIDDLRNGGDENKSHGVNEVRFKQGRMVREGLHTTLSELRLRKESRSPRGRWISLYGTPSLFIVGRERAKLGYFWRHAYRVPRSGRYLGCVVNPETGNPVIANSGRLTAADFERVKISESIESRGQKPCRPFHSALWQADAEKIRRMAPVEFIGRYMPGWFDYAICDEITNSPAIPPKEMRSALWPLVPIELWD